MTPRDSYFRLDRAPGDWREYLGAWTRRLSFAGRRDGTLATYGKSVLAFASWYGGNPLGVSKADAEGWVASMAKASGNTRLTRVKALRGFYRFLAEEGLIDKDPTAGMPLPRVLDDRMPNVLGPNAVRALLSACDGNGFYETRDAALIRFLLETGARNGEAQSVTLDSLDVENRRAIVAAKGGGEREVQFGVAAAYLLDRYLLRRRRHQHGLRRELWIGKAGAMGRDAINDALKARARQAGLPDGLHAHLLRHSWADANKRAGLSDEALRTLGGWSDRSSVPLSYGRKLRSERAREEQDRIRPFDSY